MKSKNILIVGKTGNGKSTLANVLINKNNNFEEVFKESELSNSQTKENKNEIFEHEGIKYQIIDTPGFFDTILSEDKLLHKIIEAVYSFSGNELSHVLFVTRKRFTEEEEKSYKLLKKILPEINEFTTVVRTDFSKFENPEKCKEDKNANPRLSELVKDCGERIIHVNNSTIDDDPELIKRKKCRKILVTHLKNNCSKVYERSTSEVSSKLGSLKDFIKFKEKVIKEEVITNKNNLKRWIQVCDKSKKISYLVSTLLGAGASNRVGSGSSLSATQTRFIGIITTILSHKGIHNSFDWLNKYKEEQYHESLIDVIKKDKDSSDEFFERKRSDLKKEELKIIDFAVDSSLKPENWNYRSLSETDSRFPELISRISDLLFNFSNGTESYTNDNINEVIRMIINSLEERYNEITRVYSEIFSPMNNQLINEMARYIEHLDSELESLKEQAKDEEKNERIENKFKELFNEAEQNKIQDIHNFSFQTQILSKK